MAPPHDEKSCLERERALAVLPTAPPRRLQSRGNVRHTARCSPLGSAGPVIITQGRRRHRDRQQQQQQQQLNTIMSRSGAASVTNTTACRTLPPAINVSAAAVRSVSLALRRGVVNSKQVA